MIFIYFELHKMWIVFLSYLTLNQAFIHVAASFTACNRCIVECSRFLWEWKACQLYTKPYVCREHNAPIEIDARHIAVNYTYIHNWHYIAAIPSSFSIFFSFFFLLYHFSLIIKDSNRFYFTSFFLSLGWLRVKFYPFFFKLYPVALHLGEIQKILYCFL